MPFFPSPRPVSFSNFSTEAVPPSPREIDFYLSVEFQRAADNGSSFGFEGKRHQLIDEDGIVAKISPKTVVDIYVTRSGKRVAVFDGRLWDLVEIERRQAEPKPKPVCRRKYIPGPTHPWRRYDLKAKKGRNKQPNNDTFMFIEWIL